MRWPFSRKEAPAADPGEQPAALPPRRGDWAALPAIQRAVGPAPLTLQPAFGEELASHPPAPALQPLGHHLSPTAAPGLVVAVATPQPSSVRSPAMVRRPRLQRKAEAGDASQLEPAAGEPVDAAEAEAGPAADAAVTVHPIGVQRLSQAEASPMVEPVASSAIRVAPPAPVTVTAPAGQVTLSRAVESATNPAPNPASRMTLGQVRRIGLGAPLTRPVAQRVESESPEPPLPVARHSSSSPRAPLEAPASPPPPAQVSLASPSLHPAGRVVLPLAHTVQRSAQATAGEESSEERAAEPADLAPPPGSEVPEVRAASPAPVQRLASVVETVVSGPHPVAPLELPLAPRSSRPEATPAVTDSGPQAAAAVSGPGPSLQRSPLQEGAADEETAPAGAGDAGAAPVLATAQRAMEMRSAPTSDSTAFLTPAALELPLTSAPAASTSPAHPAATQAPAMDLRPARAAAAPSLQRSEALPAAGSRPLAFPIAAAGLGTPLVQRLSRSFDDRPALQREAAGPLLPARSASPSAVALADAPAPTPIADLDSISSLPLQRSLVTSSPPLELPLAAAPRPRPPDLTVARQVAGDLVASGMAAPDADGGIRFQAPWSPSAPSAPMVAQRAEEGSAAPATAGATVSSSSPAPGAGPSGAAPSVQQVADEVMRRLRRELLVQRERSGRYHDDVS